MDTPEIVRLIEKDRSVVIINNISENIIKKLDENKNLKVMYSYSEYINNKFKTLKKLYSASFYLYFETNNTNISKLTIYFDESDFSIVEVFIKQITK